MLKFNNLMLGTENPEPLVAFYTKVLGKPAMEDGGFTGWGDQGGGFLTIGQHSEVHGQNADAARAIWFFETTDVKGEFERIRELGARVIKEPYQMGGDFWLATFADPDGNYFQLASPFEAPAGP
ncbi:MAG: hypothetical protein QOK05_2109 [Chloroflexota bacterium]|jgi:predicted enzyme related to lactoylglutathione lyase|nr:hypothetical protein [Chloroflexota bacterium]